MPVPGESDQQQLAHRREPVLAEPVALTLLGQDSFNAMANEVIQGHIGQPRLGIADRDKADQFTSRLGNRNRRCRAVCRSLGFGLVNEVTELLGELPMSAARCLRCNLHSHREESRVVAIRVAAY